jgi:hypothetical protein
MIPRPSWFSFLRTYLRSCALAFLLVVLVLGVPMALVVSWLVAR